MPLQGEQLARLDRLLDQLLAVASADRAAWVDALTGADATLAPALHDLLAQPGLLDAHSTRSDNENTVLTSWLRSAIAGGIADTLRAASFQAGAEIGPYRLLEPIGEGGMGVVWRAARSDGTLRRQVALKLPRPGLQRWHLNERFSRERDILGSLEHPNIARLYEAGVSADGQPFLAMQYVPGQPICSYADSAALDVRARVRLFVQVLSAVQHAHQRLIVHRDLKPSNILVDVQGVVHLLDFGIAQLEDETQQQAPLTEIGQAILTPQYASPEQVARAAVSTTSDIYSLGVVLCELLSGHSPYAPIRETRAALEEAILKGDTRQPSVLAPPARRPLLRGDLDNVVLRALKRNPAERYPSADAFAQDLQRYLDQVPVLAHPDGVAYRARKFLARNRVVSSAAAAVTVALVVGSGTALWQASVARQQAAHAEREALRAGAVQRFLIGLFNAADPARAQGRTLTVHDLMERAERDLRSELSDQPDSRAAVRAAMIDIYLKLGDETRALPLAQAQVEQMRTLHGAASAETGNALLALGSAQIRYGRDEAALATLRRAEAVLLPLANASVSKHADASIAALLAAQSGIADTLSELQRNVESMASWQRLMPQLIAHFGAASWEVIHAKSNVAYALMGSGRVVEANRLYDELQRLLEHVPTAHALDAANVRADMAEGWSLSGRWSDAQRALARARADFDRLEGHHNSDAIRVQRTLITVLADAGDYRAAAAVADANVQRSAAFYGSADAETALDMSFRVLPLLMTGRVDEAVAAARASVRVAASAPHPLTAPVHRGLQRRLALALLFCGAQTCANSTIEARAILEKLAAADRTDELHDGRSAATLLYLASAQRNQGDAAGAAANAAQAARIWSRRATVSSQMQAGRALLNEALAWSLARRPELANARLTTALTLLRARLPPSHVLLRSSELVRARLLRAAGQARAADALDHAVRDELRQRAGVVLPAELPLLP